MNNSKFKNDESGALLVFFALCVAAIFLIASLSFDLGRRASTQTELQSFADNVALAAAGELNGQPDAIPRAIKAANDLIRDNFTFGNGDRTLATSDDYVLTFYDSLPDPEDDPLDRLWPTALDPVPEISSRVARFARVQVNSVDVDWVFARLLTIFTSDGLPDEAVDAEATAGATTLTCDVSPVWFCLPEDFGEGEADAEDWIEANYGHTLMLRTGGGGNGGGNGNNGGGGSWVPGNFGWLDVREMIPAEALVDTNGNNPCVDSDGKPLTGSPLYNCLIGAEGSVTTCFPNGDIAFLPGQRNGITPAILNSRFDMFNATAKIYQDDSRFPTAAVTTKKYAEGSTCASQSEDDILDATDFLPDDCFFVAGSAGCQDFTNPVSGGTEARFGDGVWTDGRLKYVDINYSLDFESLGRPIEISDIDSVINGVTISEAEVEVLYSLPGNDGSAYHRDDPFRPDVYEANGITPLPAPNPEHLQLPSDAWRFDYYQAEMALSYGDKTNTATFLYDGTPGSGRVNLEPSATGVNLLPKLERDDGSFVNRQGSTVPTCSDNISLDPGRRTIVAAAVDCSLDGPNGTINGRDTGFAESYVEMFIQSVVGGTTTNGDMTMYVELLDDVKAGGGNDSTKPGIFRTLVQLYR
ncbi:Tad domain-containing protein [Boseongicola aestuarii]|nr:Tad domain-containing protein [Boseongicola aestuarii]